MKVTLLLIYSLALHTAEGVFINVMKTKTNNNIDYNLGLTRKAV